jgi:hypothetical protein
MSNFSKPAEDLGQSAREYVDLKVDDLKLRTVRGLSLSVSKILSMILIVGVASTILLALSFGLILLFGELIGSYGWAALIVAGVLCIILGVLYLLRNKLFRDSFVQLFVKLFFGSGDEEI